MRIIFLKVVPLILAMSPLSKHCQSTSPIRFVKTLSISFVNQIWKTLWIPILKTFKSPTKNLVCQTTISVKMLLITTRISFIKIVVISFSITFVKSQFDNNLGQIFINHPSQSQSGGPNPLLRLKQQSPASRICRNLAKQYY